MVSLVERYAKQIAGVLSCFDRITITGTLPGICYADGMASYLAANGVRLFDYPRFVEPMQDEIRANAEQIATCCDSLPCRDFSCLILCAICAGFCCSDTIVELGQVMLTDMMAQGDSSLSFMAIFDLSALITQQC